MHTEWVKENTLTSPLDRNTENKFRIDQSGVVLTEPQVNQALKDLNNLSFIENYPKLERRFLDPPIENQKYFLISFVPSKGATPDSQGIYGFAKVRGVYGTETEASERAEYLIRNVDSYHKIHHGFVGRPFPITLSSDFSKEVDKVQLKKSVVESTSEDIKKKRKDEEKEIEEIQQRQKELLEDTKREEPSEDRYITLKSKKAQLTWTYIQTKEKLNDMITLIAKARKEIDDLDKTEPAFKETFLKKYYEAREQSGLSNSPDQHTFLKYLVEDVSLPEIDKEYQLLFGEN
jgi:hypothetical protein